MVMFMLPWKLCNANIVHCSKVDWFGGVLFVCLFFSQWKKPVVRGGKVEGSISPKKAVVATSEIVNLCKPEGL